ncbi:MAG: hypothetical protein QJR09_14570 [Micrococcus sp.]|nr:hypothetical protein [Micrococcus sp.]
MEPALDTIEAALAYTVEHKALASAVKVIARADEVTTFITQLRETHGRRPRLQQEFDRQRLP